LVVRGGEVWLDGRRVGLGAWEALRAICLAGRSGEGALPFYGGVIGVAGYGAGLALEGVRTRHDETWPELAAGFYERALVFDRLERRVWSVGGEEVPIGEGAVPEVPRLVFRPDQEGTCWRAGVRAAVAAIRAGEIFQANLTTRYRAMLPDGVSRMEVYRALRTQVEAPFRAYLALDGKSCLLSASVERFLRLEADGAVESRPIKGTVRTGEDASVTACRLACDPKERAENIMIVDLMRNDIGRVAALGSVSVPELCVVERFGHLQHLVSCVRGRLSDGLDAVDLLRATLPPGSVTGAPKHRALQVIDRLEASARGAYCGSVFRIGVNGAMDSSVVIRSVAVDEGRVEIGAGGGITADSDADREYAEMCAKIGPLLALFGAVP